MVINNLNDQRHRYMFRKWQTFRRKAVAKGPLGLLQPRVLTVQFLQSSIATTNVKHSMGP